MLLSETSLKNVTIGKEQLSDTLVRVFMSGVGTSVEQKTTMSAGAIAVGAVSSFTVISCVAVDVFPHWSV
jgi:hypothetical protein